MGPNSDTLNTNKNDKTVTRRKIAMHFNIKYSLTLYNF